MDAPIRVLIFHPSRFLGDALRLLLDGRERLALVGVCHDRAELLRVMAMRPADVVLLHAADGGEAALREIKRRRPEQRVIVLGLDDRVEEILRLIEAGAAGYLLKEAAPGDVARSVEAVHDGRPVCPPHVAAALIGRVWQLAQAGAPPPAADPLSAREREILRMIGMGLCNKEIARALGIALCTVKNHVHRILDKLKVRRRREAARHAAANGLVRVS